MAEVKAFRGLRPIPKKIKKVASPPYDVLNSDEARTRVKDNPLSFLHVIKPEIDFDPGVDQYNKKVYAKGGENLANLINNGILIQDKKPCYYVYKLKMQGREQTGLVACASVEDYNNDRIKKHEFTRPKKEEDRLNHIDHLNAQTGPVFLTYRADEKINNLVAEAMEAEPVYDFTGDYEVQHTLYLVDNEELINKIKAAFGSINALYVADGHHRSAAACRLQRIRKDNNPNHTGEEEYNYFLSVIFPHDQMHILDYNRVVKDLYGMSEKEFIDKVSEMFEVKEYDKNEPFKPRNVHEFGMYISGKWYWLKAKEEILDDSDPIERLDVAILQNNILEKLLGITDPRNDERIDFVGGIRGLRELEKRVNEEGYKIAFSLYPTTINQLLSVPDAGKVMPPPLSVIMILPDLTCLMEG
ncbi:MAG: DUF1015 domain-containing protein, partial [bacterium]